MNIELKTKYTPTYEKHVDGYMQCNYWKFEFPNGYGASVICHICDGVIINYGCKDAPFELAVIKDNKLCYDTSITNDVIGYLTSEEVEKYLEIIECYEKYRNN